MALDDNPSASSQQDANPLDPREVRALERLALDEARDAVFLIDDGARFLYVNQEACSLSGYSRTELLAMAVPDLNPDIPWARWPDHWGQIRMQRSLVFESRHVDKSGRCYPVEISAKYLEYRQRAFSVAFVRDITRGKQAETTLRESEAYLAEAQRLSQTGSWAWNPTTGNIRYWSRECHRVLGFDPLGRTPHFEEFFERIHPDDQPRSRELFNRAICDKADFQFGYRIIHPQQGVRDIQVVGHAVRSPHGALDEFVGTVIDVTERRRAQETALRQRVYERTRIARDLHDTSLQTLHAVLLDSQVALDHIPRRATQARKALAKSIELVERAIEESRETVKGLRRSSTDTDSLTQQVRDFCGSLTAERAHRPSAAITVTVQGTEVRLHPFIRDDIYRIVCEAVRNAVQHAAATAIDVVLRYEIETLCVRIRDDGKGIDAADPDRFARHGHFGLNGMRERARLIKGALTLRRLPQSGTEVELHIPIDHNTYGLGAADEPSLL